MFSILNHASDIHSLLAEMCDMFQSRATYNLLLRHVKTNKSSLPPNVAVRKQLISSKEKFLEMQEVSDTEVVRQNPT